MTFPYITSLTTGVILILQMVLAAMVSRSRGADNSWVGDGGKDGLLRAMRRHGKLAENAGLFMVGFALLEMSNTHPTLLIALCGIFVALRVLHAIGLSQANSNNVLRLIGGAGTYVVGLILGGKLAYIGWLATAAAR